MAGIRNDVIDTGYIPVEYNTYLTLTEKAEKYDRMMGALKEYNRKHVTVNKIKKAAKEIDRASHEGWIYPSQADYENFMNGKSDYIKLDVCDEETLNRYFGGDE